MRISLRVIVKVSCSLLVALIFLFAWPLGAQHTSPAADAQKPPLLSAMEVGALDVAFGAADAKHLAVRLEQRGLPGRVGFYDCGHRRAQGHFERVGLEAAEAREADAFETQRTGFR